MTAGRPIAYEPDAALAAVMHAFWQRGYEGTSLADLLAATGLSKSSFYQAFGSKQAAFEQALAHYCDTLIAELRVKLRTADSGLAFIEAVLRGAAAEAVRCAEPRGCMIVNVATEFSARDPRIRTAIAQNVRRVTQVFVAAVKRAQAEGAIPAGREPRVLGRYVLSCLAGLRTLVKAGTGHRALGELIAVQMAGLN
ncbi:MAG: TetR/AcrR family transcriptional regulator [Gammaproteobacteria bacterium]|nr:TetR/AcrR family transcriptional regulator [Gammaproteobacteria bacterium]